MKTGKSSRKPQDAKQALAVKRVAKQYGCSEAYVYGILRGDYAGGRTEEIRRSFNEIYNQIKQALA